MPHLTFTCPKYTVQTKVNIGCFPCRKFQYLNQRPRGKQNGRANSRVWNIYHVSDTDIHGHRKFHRKCSLLTKLAAVTKLNLDCDLSCKSDNKSMKTEKEIPKKGKKKQSCNRTCHIKNLTLKNTWNLLYQNNANNKRCSVSARVTMPSHVNTFASCTFLTFMLRLLI